MRSLIQNFLTKYELSQKSRLHFRESTKLYETGVQWWNEFRERGVELSSI